MTPVAVFVEGARRVWRAPALTAGLWLVTIGVTVPPAIALHQSIEDHLGSSLAADSAAEGVNARWMQEFNGSSLPLAPTLRTDVIGFAAVVDNASALADALPRPSIVVSAGAVYLFMLTFLSSGVIDRLARDRPLRAYGFFGACDGLWFRMLRLTAISALFYLVMFDSLHPWLFDTVYRGLTRDTTVERTAFAIRAVLYVALFGIIGICSLVFDYARVRLVVEDRRSAIAAVAAAIRFVARHPRAAVGAYVINVGAVLAVLAAYAAIAPGAGHTGWTMWSAFIVGQLFIVARLGVKLTFWAAEAALFQSQLAHAGYVRRPVPQWPDPAALEAGSRAGR
jgi:hypothetical protein